MVCFDYFPNWVSFGNCSCRIGVWGWIVRVYGMPQALPPRVWRAWVERVFRNIAMTLMLLFVIWSISLESNHSRPGEDLEKSKEITTSRVAESFSGRTMVKVASLSVATVPVSWSEERTGKFSSMPFNWDKSTIVSSQRAITTGWEVEIVKVASLR